jgi:hypothetical protein
MIIDIHQPFKKPTRLSALSYSNGGENSVTAQNVTVREAPFAITGMCYLYLIVMSTISIRHSHCISTLNIHLNICEIRELLDVRADKTRKMAKWHYVQCLLHY